MKNNIWEVSAEICVGCGACVATCPVDAVSMQEKDCFYYPVVDETKCIDCGKCKKSCAVLAKDPKREKGLAWYAGYIEPAKMSTHSTSGGICTELTKQYILEGHNVYAAAFDGNWNLSHRRVEGLEELETFSGSKYLQSSISKEIYEEIACKLKNGEKCLFIGTPCQVGGLAEYLRTNKAHTEKLLTVDFMCHGAPSPVLGQRFIKHLENKTRKKITYYNFRSKAYGWGRLERTLEFADGSKKMVSASICPLHGWFGRHLSVRKSCFDCAYRTKERVSDITVADFWGVNKHYPHIPTKQGISAIQVNTEKGETVYDYLVRECNLVSYEVVQEHFWDRKTPLNNYPRPEGYDAFWENAKSLPIGALIKKFPPQTKIGYVKQFVKSILGRH